MLNQYVAATAEDVTVTACVQRGAALLDNLRPEWHTLIDTDNLHMIDPNECIAGQVFKEYEALTGTGYTYLLGKLQERQEPHRMVPRVNAEGFTYDQEWTPGMWYGMSGDMDALKDEWVRLINERL